MKYYLKNMIFVSNSECGYAFLKELTAGGCCSVNMLCEKFLPPIIRILFHFSKNSSAQRLKNFKVKFLSKNQN